MKKRTFLQADVERVSTGSEVTKYAEYFIWRRSSARASSFGEETFAL